MENSPPKPMLEGLDKLYQFLNTKSLSQAHLLFLAVYVIALRTGFVSQNFYINHIEELFLLQPWSTFDKRNLQICCNEAPTYEHDAPHDTYFRVTLVSLVENGQTDTLKSVLTAIVTGDFMVITLTPKSSKLILGRSSCLSIGRYVISHSESQQSLNGCYQKFDQLEAQLRDEVFMPVRSEQLSLMSAFPQPSLIGIPRELRFRIYIYFHDLKERAKLRCLNKEILEEINIFDALNY